MITDSNLELATWDSHVGTDIGGVAPTSYGWRDHPLDPLVREFYVSGPKYSDWLAACHRPVLPTTGSLTLDFDFYVDSNVALNAQALEFDTKLAIAGKMFNWSSQFNYQTGVWQVSDAAGNWIDTVYRFLKFQPNRLYQMHFQYLFDPVKLTYSFVDISGPAFATAGKMPAPLTATATNWTDSCNLQVQQDLNANGGQFSQYMRNIRYTWA